MSGVAGHGSAETAVAAPAAPDVPSERPAVSLGKNQWRRPPCRRFGEAERESSRRFTAEPGGDAGLTENNFGPNSLCEAPAADVLPWPLSPHPSGRSLTDDQAGAVALRRMLVGHYDDLKRRLTRRLGSADLAGDALQDAYLHLERCRSLGIVGNPQQYLLTMATNIARMAARRQQRWAGCDDMEAISAVVDDGPDPLRSLEARRELAALRQVFQKMSPRRRRILSASRIEGVRLCDLAAECGLSQRMVEKELKAALMQCGAALGRDIVQRFGPRRLPEMHARVEGG